MEHFVKKYNVLRPQQAPLTYKHSTARLTT